VEFAIINIKKFLLIIKEFEIAINKPSLVTTNSAIQQILLNTQDIKKAVENRNMIGLSFIWSHVAAREINSKQMIITYKEHSSLT
jgi:hypothetical protein